jgi:hypothetical protein
MTIFLFLLFSIIAVAGTAVYRWLRQEQDKLIPKNKNDGNWMGKRIEQENLYQGLLGLDNLDTTFKVINFIITVIIGVILTFISWKPSLYFEYTAEPFSPFAWPLIFLLWPICGVILWLRITGLSWYWSTVPVAFIFMLLYALVSLILSFLRALVGT